jgi:hypothetical protein
MVLEKQYSLDNSSTTTTLVLSGPLGRLALKRISQLKGLSHYSQGWLGGHWQCTERSRVTLDFV